MKNKKHFLAHFEAAQNIIVMNQYEAKRKLKNIAAQITSAQLGYSGWYGVNLAGVNTLYVTPENAHFANIKLDEKFIADSKIISQEDFWNLTQVIAGQHIQKVNAFGSVKHRDSVERIYNLAVEHGVQQYFETMEDYDQSVDELNKLLEA